MRQPCSRDLSLGRSVKTLYEQERRPFGGRAARVVVQPRRRAHGRQPCQRRVPVRAPRGSGACYSATAPHRVATTLATARAGRGIGPASHWLHALPGRKSRAAAVDGAATTRTYNGPAARVTDLEWEDGEVPVDACRPPRPCVRSTAGSDPGPRARNRRGRDARLFMAISGLPRSSRRLSGACPEWLSAPCSAPRDARSRRRSHQAQPGLVPVAV